MKYTTIAITTILTGFVSAQTVTPYSDGSTIDQLLSFDLEDDATVVANKPGLVFILTNNTSTKTGSGGGWALSASGSTSIGIAFAIVGNSSAVTSTGAGYLDFGVDTFGLNQIAGIALPMKWSANTDVPGSGMGAWVEGQATYNFDLNLDNGVLGGLDVSLFNGLSLKITDQNDVPLYQSTNVAQLLGITSLTDTTYNNRSVSFAYDPTTNGMLNIEWSGTQAIGADLLNVLGGNGYQSVYKISNTGFTITPTAVPEPTSIALLSLGSLSLLARRKR